MKKTIEETDDGFELHIRTKRGSGTRDEDTVSIRGHFETLEELRLARGEAINALENYAGDVRSVQPTLKRDEE